MNPSPLHNDKANNKYKRISNDEGLGTAMMRMLEAYGLKSKYNESRLKASWEQVVGQSIAKQTVGLQVTEGILWVKVRSAALRQELTFSREKIKTRLNEILQDNFLQDVRIG